MNLKENVSHQQVVFSKGDLVFIHIGAFTTLWDIMINNEAEVFFINMSSKGAPHISTGKANNYNCMYNADDFAKQPRLSQFIKKFGSNSPIADIIDLLGPIMVRYRLIALSILCQGYLVAHSDDKTLKGQWNKVVVNQSLVLNGKKITENIELYWKPPFHNHNEFNLELAPLEQSYKSIGNDIEPINKTRNFIEKVYTHSSLPEAYDIEEVQETLSILIQYNGA